MKKTKMGVKLPSLGDDRGCCCKRSACRKKYCECFRMNASCTMACKCIGCGNSQQSFTRDMNSPSVELQNEIKTPAFEVKYNENAYAKNNEKKEAKSKLPKAQKETEAAITQIAPNKNDNPIHFTVKEDPVLLNFINEDVVEASIECMLAQANECTQTGLNESQTQRMVLEEFDRCLMGILASMEISEDFTGQVFM